MGRVFEKRKHKIFARNAKLSKTFTRIGKEISMAVKSAGPNPENNPRLKQAMQNAKGSSMPKDRIEAAIKRASNKDLSDYEEALYEGFAPHGVALLIETATDNTTRTVANMRMYFNRGEGSLGNSGSVSFLFERKGLFKFPKNNLNLEDLELELIDSGLLDIIEDDGNVFLYSSFEDFGTMSKALEERGIETTSAELVREPLNTVEVTEEQAEQVQALCDKIEEDEDVQNVFHNMA
ncbi:MAG: YebC/PmpR family DNA-binding transcriptional regulator [Bacteroidetes bacterium]|nr:YebC/PmpR family DNA-binding transcriptional regulator [Bacteroidota bacterium]